jgi:Protein of unknown function (DUF3102)
MNTSIEEIEEIVESTLPENKKQFAASGLSERRALPTPAFDYDTIAADLAEDLRSDAERIRERITKSMSDLIEIGRDLNAVKARLAHGQFLQWVEAEIGIHRRTAQRYMQVADLAEAKGDMVSFLTPGAAYRLSAKSTPPEVVTTVMRRIEAGEVLSDKAIDSLVREKKGRQKDEQRGPRKKLEQDPSMPAPVPFRQSDQRHDHPESEDQVEVIARKLFASLGPELTSVVLDALKQDTLLVLGKLQELLSRSCAPSSLDSEAGNDRPPAQVQGVAPSSVRDGREPEMPDIPPFLDRRTRT